LQNNNQNFIPVFQGGLNGELNTVWILLHNPIDISSQKMANTTTHGLF